MGPLTRRLHLKFLPAPDTHFHHKPIATITLKRAHSCGSNWWRYVCVYTHANTSALTTPSPQAPNTPHPLAIHPVHVSIRLVSSLELCLFLLTVRHCFFFFFWPLCRRSPVSFLVMSHGQHGAYSGAHNDLWQKALNLSLQVWGRAAEEDGHREWLCDQQEGECWECGRVLGAVRAVSQDIHIECGGGL